MEVSLRCVSSLQLQLSSSPSPQQRCSTGSGSFSSLWYSKSGSRVFQSRSGQQFWTVKAAAVAAGGLHHRHRHYHPCQQQFLSWNPEDGGGDRALGDLNGLRRNARFDRNNLVHPSGGPRGFDPCHAKNNWFGGSKETEEEAVQDVSSAQKVSWPVLERWDIPWDGKVTSLGMVAWLVSFLLTGLLLSVLAAQVGFGRRQLLSSDDQAIYVFVHQLAQTIAGLGVVNTAVSPYKPLAADLFSIQWESPFDLRRGWILWGSIGILCSGAAVVAASYITVSINGQPPPRDETDALVQLMPIIGASPLSTLSLISVTGVLAPILEETIFRGFLMTSLTKWLPTPVAVLISAFAFAGAHLTPGEFPQLAALGVILGFSYAQTRNLLTPMLIHSIWNSGVVVLLTLLRLQGYDLKELI
ncbi:unnamed protein product [Calypogeia fissa]